MRKLVAVCLLALPLGGCWGAGTTSPTTPIVVVDETVANVRNIAVQVCGYLPAAETVARLIEVFGGPAIPGVASQIAREICAVMTAPKATARRGTVGPTLHGVLIHGQFVR